MMFLSVSTSHRLLFLLAGAGVVAYVLGKMSYAGECRKKILKLENSPLADSIRQKKGGPTELFQEMYACPPGFISKCNN